MGQSLASKIERIQQELNSVQVTGNDELTAILLMGVSEIVAHPGVPTNFGKEVERIRRNDFELQKAVREANRLLHAEESTAEMLNENKEHLQRFIEWEQQKLRLEECSALMRKLHEYVSEPDSDETIIGEVVINMKRREVTYKEISRSFVSGKMPWSIVRTCSEQNEADFENTRKAWKKTDTEMYVELNRMNEAWKELNMKVFCVRDGFILIDPKPIKSRKAKVGQR